MTGAERLSAARELNRKASRSYYERLKADRAAYKARIARQVERRRLMSTLVFESDYVKAGLGHLLEGAVEV